jgi:hypothetical protein
MIATFTVMTEGGSAAPGDPANGEHISFLGAIQTLRAQLWYNIKGVLNIIQINATINDAASRARGAARVSI